MELIKLYDPICIKEVGERYQERCKNEACKDPADALRIGHGNIDYSA
jgi:hypothetical protein